MANQLAVNARLWACNPIWIQRSGQMVTVNSFRGEIDLRNLNPPQGRRHHQLTSDDFEAGKHFGLIIGEFVFPGPLDRDCPINQTNHEGQVMIKAAKGIVDTKDRLVCPVVAKASGFKDTVELYIIYGDRQLPSGLFDAYRIPPHISVKTVAFYPQFIVEKSYSNSTERMESWVSAVRAKLAGNATITGETDKQAQLKYVVQETVTHYNLQKLARNPGIIAAMKDATSLIMGQSPLNGVREPLVELEVHEANVANTFSMRSEFDDQEAEEAALSFQELWPDVDEIPPKVFKELATSLKDGALDVAVKRHLQKPMLVLFSDQRRDWGEDAPGQDPTPEQITKMVQRCYRDAKQITPDRSYTVKHQEAFGDLDNKAMLELLNVVVVLLEKLKKNMESVLMKQKSVFGDLDLAICPITADGNPWSVEWLLEAIVKSQDIESKTLLVQNLGRAYHSLTYADVAGLKERVCNMLETVANFKELLVDEKPHPLFVRPRKMDRAVSTDRESNGDSDEEIS